LRQGSRDRPIKQFGVIIDGLVIDIVKVIAQISGQLEDLPILRHIGDRAAQRDGEALLFHPDIPGQRHRIREGVQPETTGIRVGFVIAFEGW
jgi:hypothetical protein